MKVHPPPREDVPLSDTALTLPVPPTSRVDVSLSDTAFIPLPYPQVDVVVFDKTGTLTAGKPNVTAVTPSHSGRMDAATVLRLAAIVESNTTHPVAQVGG